MTRAKSGLPSDDSTGNTTGLTSLCNRSESAADLRQRALETEQSLKLGQRYETAPLTELTSWPAGSVDYKLLPNPLQRHVRDYYNCVQLRNAASSESSSTNLRFDQLNESVHNGLASRVCDIHTIMVYNLFTQVIPEYIASHTLGGEQTIHWESIPPGSDQERKRQLVLDRMNSMQGGSLVGCQGLLLDYYGWRKDIDDIGIVHLLHRDLPSSNHKVDDDEDDDEDDDDIEAAHRTATRSKSTRSILSS